MEAISKVFAAIKDAGIKARHILEDNDSKYLSSSNSAGDRQLDLDVRLNELFYRRILAVEDVFGFCSEEEEEAYYKLERTEGLLVAYDPLDGSSVIGSNFSMGSVFGIYDGYFHASRLVAACYLIYGPRLEFISAHEAVEREICLRGDFTYIEDIRLERSGGINASGGTQKNWGDKHRGLIDSFFDDGYRLRYSGAMVADLHNILMKRGGLFSYPENKLRKLFEVFPFAFIFKCAGGGAIDNAGEDLLDLECEGVHDTTPCFFGSEHEINRVKEALNAR